MRRTLMPLASASLFAACQDVTQPVVEPPGTGGELARGGARTIQVAEPTGDAAADHATHVRPAAA